MKRKWLVGVGGLLWLALWLVPLGQGVLEPISRILLLAVLVIVPLALGVMEGSRSIFLITPALLGMVSFLRPVGVQAGVAALGWFIFALYIAFAGLVRLLSRGWQQTLPVLCLDIAGVYLLVGSIWLVASRWGVSFLGFQEPIVLLTAVHFHYAGFAVSVLAGLAGRQLQAVNPQLPLGYYLGAGGAILAVPLTAVGILAAPLVEAVAAALLAASLLLLSFVVVTRLVPRLHSRLAQGLLVISAVSLLLTMTLAVLYAMGEFTDQVLVSIPGMVQWHGWVNSVGFALCGLLGWAVEKR